MTVRKGLAAMAAKTWWYSRSHGCENVVILSQPWLQESGDTLVSAKAVELRSDGCDKARIFYTENAVSPLLLRARGQLG